MHCLDEEFKNIVTIICQYCRVLKRPDAMIYHATMTAYRTHCSNEMENDEVPLASRKVPKNTGKSQAAGDKTEGKYKSWYQVYLKDKRDGVPEEDCRVPKKHPHRKYSQSITILDRVLYSESCSCKFIQMKIYITRN